MEFKKIVGSGTMKGCQSEKFTVHNTWFCLAKLILRPNSQSLAVFIFFHSSSSSVFCDSIRLKHSMTQFSSMHKLIFLFEA